MSDASRKFRTRHQFGKKTRKLSRKRGGQLTELGTLITDATIVGSKNDVANGMATGTADVPAASAPAIASASMSTVTRQCPGVAAEPDSVVVAATPAMSASKRKLALFTCEYNIINVNYLI